MGLDYEVLRLIWWALLGILLIGFAVLDGFDLGAAMLLPYFGRNDVERRIVINSVAPVWEGNQVWLILGAGAAFAAWPHVYAVSFSGFYGAMFLALFAIVLRPVGFKYRSKMPSQRWRTTWDWLLVISGFVPSLVFGIAFGNLFLGVPFHFDDTLRLTYSGTFWQLLSPFALLCGGVSVVMLALQGTTYIAMKTEGHIQERAQKLARRLSPILIALFTFAGVVLVLNHPSYEITSAIDPLGPSNPTFKEVTAVPYGWLQRYQAYPLLWVVPALCILALILVMAAHRWQRNGIAFVCSSLATTSIIATAGLSLFPFLLISSSHPGHSLSVWDASSTEMTLRIMLIVVALLLPIVLAYTAWMYRVFRGPITDKTLDDEKLNAY
ncbi:MAG: cytochrome d ubiquinol oxidase subunit II [Holosporales bacterium]